MPCMDGGPTAQEVERENRQYIKKLSRMLCASMTYLANSGHISEFLKEFDESKAGIKKSELQSWWASHIAKDRQRKAKEIAKQKLEELKSSALAKLTQNERKALGV